MKKLQGKTESLDFFGNGIVRVDGVCCFIKNALPGEDVVFEVTEEKKRYKRGRPLSFREPSPARITPPCSHYGVCGGCQFQHTTYAVERQAKTEHLLRLVSPWMDDETKVFPLSEEPAALYGYRNHLTCHVVEGKLCFYRENSHAPVEIEACALAEEPLNEALALLKEIPLNGATEVELRRDSEDNVVAVIHGDPDADFSALVGADKAFRGIALVDGATVKSFGDTTLFYELADKRFMVPPRCFFQKNTMEASSMLRVIKELLKDVPRRRIFDLYCGVGSIGIAVAEAGDEVCGIEINDAAVTAAKENAAANGISAHFESAKTEKALKDFLNKMPVADLVIVDPPRQGLQKDTAQILSDYAASHLLYISCDPATLARDLKTLTKTYKIKALHPVDLFPRTGHVETVVLMSRKDT